MNTFPQYITLIVDEDGTTYTIQFVALFPKSPTRSLFFYCTVGQVVELSFCPFWISCEIGIHLRLDLITFKLLPLLFLVTLSPLRLRLIKTSVSRTLPGFSINLLKGLV
jgi:hypothetical protein